MSHLSEIGDQTLEPENRISDRAAKASDTKPAHIAIIMDGNGRWATERKLARAKGHQQGAEALRAILEGCRARPYIRQLTLYTFSYENWHRPSEEVQDLMNLLRHYVKREAKSLHAHNVRVCFIGECAALAPDIQRDLEEVRALTANNTGMTVCFAISYGARQEITHAVQRIAQKVASGEVAPELVNETLIAAHLHTESMPDPDLLIRTGGEQRLSNFLLWQSAYAEFYFTDTLWPEFTLAEFDEAVQCFSQRERRFGKRKEA